MFSKFLKIFNTPLWKYVSISKNKNSQITYIEKQTIIEKKKINLDELVVALKSQNESQINSQINSGKYLKNTFIESGNQKDYLRYFTSPIFYIEKFFDYVNVLDFSYLNKLLKMNGHETFDLDIQKFFEKKKDLKIEHAKDYFENLYNHFEVKRKFISDNSNLGNGRGNFEYKIKNLIEELNFFKSKVVLITEMAGQGKTNFLCDFVENFMLKKEILNVFLTGIEINPNDIRSSILKRIFPDNDNLDFAELLNAVQKYCYENNEVFVIIIDGINENFKSKIFSKNLEMFISDMQKYEFVKIIMSCRIEYYKDNFKNLENADFSSDMIFIDKLMEREVESKIKKKLFHVYFENFNIKYNSISWEIKEQLLSNFLLFRIFCETNENKELDRIDNIYKEELFTNYYNRKTEHINLMLNDINGGVTSGSIDIKNFIKKIIEKMIEKKQYINIELDEIINSSSGKEIYIRFLDENILVKRDIISSEKNLFSPTEVVNFTFDEFRDFLISDYIIEMYKKSNEIFYEFLNSLSDDSPLIEGCSTFLFYKARRIDDKELSLVLTSQKWYKSVFSRCIFNIQEELITDNDKSNLKELIFDSTFHKRDIIIALINRRENQTLNLEFLFECLREMNEEEFEDNFIKAFENTDYRYYRIDQQEILEILEEALKVENLSDAGHKFYEILLYMFLNTNNYNVKELYERYYFRNIIVGSGQIKKALTSKNKKLVEAITKFLERYGIEL